MSLLEPATSTPAAAKIGLFGSGGAGNTVTAALLALGLSRTYHDGAPVAFFDTDDQAGFVREMFHAEGVPLFRIPSRAFVDLRAGLADAQRDGCCAYIVDSYRDPWQELHEALKDRLGLVGRRLQSQHREHLLALWSAWVREMRRSPLHCILAGRLADEWDDIEDETGAARSVKLMDAGYETNLLVELAAVSAPPGAPSRKKSAITHTAYVLKDRALVLNGRRRAFRDLTAYKPGDYRRVFEAFRPHFDKLSIGVAAAAAPVERSSGDLFVAPENTYASRTRRATIAIEEIKASLTTVWPGQDATSKELRQTATETLFGARSWTAIEGFAPEVLEIAQRVMHGVEARAKSKPLTTAAAVIEAMQDSATQEGADGPRGSAAVE